MSKYTNGLKIITAVTDAAILEPSSSAALSAFQAINELKAGIARRKFEAFFNSYREALGEDASSGSLICQAVKNISDEVGSEYFNQALYSAVNNADSELRAQLLGTLTANAGKDAEVRENYWVYVDQINRFVITDLKAIKDNYHNCFKKITGYNSLLKKEDRTKSKYKFEKTKFINTELLAEKLGAARLQRLLGLNLCHYGEHGHVKISSSDLSRFLKAISYIS